METRKLSFNEMELIEGGSRRSMWDCLGTAFSGVGLLMGAAAASGPAGWLGVGIGAIGFGIYVGLNPDVCE